ncbi:MAG: hypothetical protein ACK6DQ_13540 [Planctomycetota bacterium]
MKLTFALVVTPVLTPLANVTNVHSPSLTAYLPILQRRSWFWLSTEATHAAAKWPERLKEWLADSKIMD